MNKVESPWDILLPSGSSQVGRIGLNFPPETIQPAYLIDYEGLNTAVESRVTTRPDQYSGRLLGIDQTLDGVTMALADFTHDAFGRLTSVKDRTQQPAVDKRLINDWLTGNILLEENQTADATYIHNHGAGHTRVAEAAGEEPVEQWLLRGPQGQVRWVLENDLAVKQWFGYSSLGNRIAGQEITPPAILRVGAAHVPTVAGADRGPPARATRIPGAK